MERSSDSPSDSPSDACRAGCWEGLKRGLRAGRGSDEGSAVVGCSDLPADTLVAAWGEASAVCSASKYAGCNGGGAGWPEASAGDFLRRCMRSRIHFRIRAFNTEERAGAIGSNRRDAIRNPTCQPRQAIIMSAWLEPFPLRFAVRTTFLWSRFARLGLPFGLRCGSEKMATGFM